MTQKSQTPLLLFDFYTIKINENQKLTKSKMMDSKIHICLIKLDKAVTINMDNTEIFQRSAGDGRQDFQRLNYNCG